MRRMVAVEDYSGRGEYLVGTWEMKNEETWEAIGSRAIEEKAHRR